ncbi:hypothetical protein BGZ95_003615, partial [Linnemannia exigua]
NNHDAGTEGGDGTASELDDYFYALLVQVLVISDDREAGVFGKLPSDSDPQVAIEHMLQEAEELGQSYRLAKSLSTCEAVPDNLQEEMRLQDDVVQSDRELAQPVCLMDAGDVDKYESLKREIENPCPPLLELDEAASRVISENDWKVCERCGAVVERVSGCVHITCMCRNEFCYTCRKTWKTCKCELYPVEELNQILDERVGNGDPGVARDRLRNVLQNYYQHQHNWERRNSNGQRCGVCRWDMPVYCMHCEGCMETRCRSCAFNR